MSRYHTGNGQAAELRAMCHELSPYLDSWTSIYGSHQIQSLDCKLVSQRHTMLTHPVSWVQVRAFYPPFLDILGSCQKNLDLKTATAERCQVALDLLSFP